MTTKTKTGAAKTTTSKKAPAAIDIKPQAEAKQVKDGTKVHALIEVLSQKGGATLQQCAEALSFKGNVVDLAMARSWIRTDLCALKGYGITQKGDKLSLLKPKAMAA